MKPAIRVFIAVAIGFLLLPPSAAVASVTIGGLSYSIASVSRASTVGPGQVQESASSEFIVIRLTVRNKGKEPATISNSDFHLKAGGASYDAASAGTMSGGFFLENLDPGVSVTGTLLFLVPANTTRSNYRLVVSGNGGAESKEIPL